RARLDAEAERRKDQLVAEIAALANQKKAIQAQLNQIVGIGRQAASAGDQADGEWPSALYPPEETLPAESAEAESSPAKAGKRKPRTNQVPGPEDADEQQPVDEGPALEDGPADDDAESTVIRKRDEP
ncbi:MAG TPA: hypothetical protein VIL68_14395, partial [Propionibacteriaceae bacterium]